MSADEEPQSLKALFADAESKRESLDEFPDSNTETFQENLRSAIAAYEGCLKVVDRISLFSSNETLEDVSSNDLQYMAIHYHLAVLVQRITGGDRLSYLQRALKEYDQFLRLLDTYDALSKAESQLYEQFRSDPKNFSTAPVNDAARRREIKITRFKAEKELKQKLQHLRQNPNALENDEDALRQLHLTNLHFYVHQAFDALDSMRMEFQILAMAPPAPTGNPNTGSDSDRRQRERGQAQPFEYSERLDGPVSRIAGLQGPLLSKDGKPLRPFTLIDNRERMRQGVFRPDHSLPTMSIDEYLEEEKKRGGIIEGGGPQSEIRPEPDEDNIEKADEETMKARAWDEFTEENPKGSGNTLNRG